MASLKMDPLDPKKAKSLSLNVSIRNVRRIEAYAKQADISRSKLVQTLLVLALDGLDQNETQGGRFNLSFFNALPDRSFKLVFSQIGRVNRDDGPDALKKIGRAHV